MDANKKMKKSGFDTPYLLQHFQDSYCKATEPLLWRVLSQTLKHLFFNAEIISTFSHNNRKCIEILKQNQLLLQSIKR